MRAFAGAARHHGDPRLGHDRDVAARHDGRPAGRDDGRGALALPRDPGPDRLRRARPAWSGRTAPSSPGTARSVGELEVTRPVDHRLVLRQRLQRRGREADAAAKFDDGWLRTGDVGSLTPDGFLTLTDRAKDVIKSGGEWISSVDLENALMAHPDVIEACVVGVPDDKWGERPLATVVLRARVGGRRRRAAGVPRRPGGAAGRCPSAGPSSTRCRRPASASSTRRRCAGGTPRATCRSRPWPSRTGFPTPTAPPGRRAPILGPRAHVVPAARHPDRRQRAIRRAAGTKSVYRRRGCRHRGGEADHLRLSRRP